MDDKTHRHFVWAAEQNIVRYRDDLAREHDPHRRVQLERALKAELTALRRLRDESSQGARQD